MSCVVAGLRYYFRIYKYEYLGELMTSELHMFSKVKILCNFEVDLLQFIACSMFIKAINLFNLKKNGRF